MKLILVTLALAVAVSAFELDENSPEFMFSSFKSKHGRVYASEEEHSRRLSIFTDNLKRIDAMNRADPDATYGITQFSDLTEEEFTTLYLSSNEARDAFFEGVNSEPAELLSTDDLPDAFDWREKGAVTDVKNQGQCGSCWAFATTGNIEGVWAKAGNKLTSLSEQNLVDCDRAGVDAGCQGGLPEEAYKFIVSQGGIATEESYPYKGVDGKCQFSSATVGAKISNHTTISKDETQIQAALIEHGPLSIGINAGWMQFYFGGISNPPFLCNPKKLDHGVLIVGYGSDPKPYWIIKNSWGGSWGEKGYYRIIRGKGKCGLNEDVTSSLL